MHAALETGMMDTLSILMPQANLVSNMIGAPDSIGASYASVITWCGSSNGWLAVVPPNPESEQLYHALAESFEREGLRFGDEADARRRILLEVGERFATGFFVALPPDGKHKIEYLSSFCGRDLWIGSRCMARIGRDVWFDAFRLRVFVGFDEAQ